MRLTIINQFYRPDVSPTATLSASLAEDRARRGDEVTVIAGRGGYTGGEASGAPDAGAGKIRIRRVWTPGLGKASHLKRLIDYAAFYLFAVARILTMRRQDVIVALTTPPLIAWAGLLHKRLHPRTRLILWNMDCYPDVAERAGVMKPGGFAARFVRARTRAIFRRLDHLVCLDTAMAELLCSQYAWVNSRLPVTIIPNWEDASYFPADPEPPPFRGFDDLPINGRRIILYLGNMGYGHSFDTVLDAAEQLRGQPVCFVFIGGGRMWQDVKDEAARRGLGNILMHPYIPKDQTPSAMHSATAALVTLRDEALGIMSPSKIHSNLAMGLPLIYIGPERSNVDDAIRQHECGVSVRHGDVAGLVGFIERLVQDADECAALRSRARAAFDRAYCDLATLPAFDAVLSQIMAAPGSQRTAADYARSAASSAATSAPHPAPQPQCAPAAAG